MKIAFLGDSITLGYGLTDMSARYTTTVAHALSAEELNYGITGTLIARAGLSIDNGSSFIDRCFQLAGADKAVIFGGTNDYFWSDSPITSSDDSYTQPRGRLFTEAVDILFSDISSMFDKSSVLIVTPYPHRGIGNYKGASHWQDSNEHDTDTPNYCGAVLEDYVNVLEQHADKYGFSVLNLHELCRETQFFNHSLHTIDGCHPNEEGHDRLAEVIIDAISKQQ